MTEHEMLKEICDLIEYESGYGDTIRRGYIYKGEEELDVREVIFTQEFMDLLEQYFNIEHNFDDIRYNIISHLNNPVQYLYDTLQLGNQ